MAKKLAPPGPSLFDLFEPMEKTDPAKCKHRHERKTFTVWPGETWDRLTWTCEDCGRIRGRIHDA